MAYFESGVFKAGVVVRVRV